MSVSPPFVVLVATLVACTTSYQPGRSSRPAVDVQVLNAPANEGRRERTSTSETLASDCTDYASQNAARIEAAGYASSFEHAKRLGWRIYRDHQTTFYCGCPYTGSEGSHAATVDHWACGYEPRTPGSRRSDVVEWEHIVPVSRLRQVINCRDRVECLRHHEAFRDLHNLVPAVGEINAYRSDHAFGNVPGEERVYGACDFETADGIAEPRERVRGDIARTYFYMEATHGMTLTEAERIQFTAWSEADPVDTWERIRLERIDAIQNAEQPIPPAPDNDCVIVCDL